MARNREPSHGHDSSSRVTVPTPNTGSRMSLGTQFTPVIEAARTGAPWALEALYRDLHPRVLRYLRAHESGYAEDLASDTWIGVAKGIPSFKGDEEDFRAFVFTVARRRVLDHRRTEARRRTYPDELASLERHGPTADAEDDAMDQLGQGWALRLVSQLPPDQADVVMLRVLADLPVKDVAAILGKQPGAVRALQFRAVRRLADILAQEAVTP
jgi:RNA polymerase sigma-70 factor (ECF subfamily)